MKKLITTGRLAACLLIVLAMSAVLTYRVWAQQSSGAGSLDWNVNMPSAQNHWNRGVFFLNRSQEGDLHWARQEFEFIIGMKDDHGLKPAALLNLGVANFLDGNNQLALQNYKSALELRPDYAEAYFNMGTVYYKEKLVKNAEESFLKAINLNPEYGRAHYSLGFLYLEQKKFALAKQHAEKAADYGVPFKTLKERLAKVGR